MAVARNKSRHGYFACGIKNGLRLDRPGRFTMSDRCDTSIGADRNVAFKRIFFAGRKGQHDAVRDEEAIARRLSRSSRVKRAKECRENPEHEMGPFATGASERGF